MRIIWGFYCNRPRSAESLLLTANLLPVRYPSSEDPFNLLEGKAPDSVVSIYDYRDHIKCSNVLEKLSAPRDEIILLFILSIATAHSNICSFGKKSGERLRRSLSRNVKGGLSPPALSASAS